MNIDMLSLGSLLNNPQFLKLAHYFLIHIPDVLKMGLAIEIIFYYILIFNNIKKNTYMLALLAFILALFAIHIFLKIEYNNLVNSICTLVFILWHIIAIHVLIIIGEESPNDPNSPLSQ